jgi:Protein of unknown function (DUF2892)
MNLHKNVGRFERWGSLAAGGALLAYALRRDDRASAGPLALALAGAGLAFRGASGFCPLYGALGVDRAEDPEAWRNLGTRDTRSTRGTVTSPVTGRPWPLPEGARRIRDDEPESLREVEEASRQSFPASDPPAFSPSRVG